VSSRFLPAPALGLRLGRNDKLLDGAAKFSTAALDLRLACARRTDGASVPTWQTKSPLPAKAAGNGAPGLFCLPGQRISLGAVALPRLGRNHKLLDGAAKSSTAISNLRLASLAGRTGRPSLHGKQVPTSGKGGRKWGTRAFLSSPQADFSRRRRWCSGSVEMTRLGRRRRMSRRLSPNSGSLRSPDGRGVRPYMANKSPLPAKAAGNGEPGLFFSSAPADFSRRPLVLRFGRNDKDRTGASKSLDGSLRTQARFARRTDEASVPLWQIKVPLPAKGGRKWGTCALLRSRGCGFLSATSYGGARFDNLSCNRVGEGRHRRGFRELSAKSVHRGLQEANFKGPR
jgi:hypothetical protein